MNDTEHDTETADQADGALTLLRLAQQMQDQLIAEARNQADKIVADANEEAGRALADAYAQADKVKAEASAQVEELQERIAGLRAFEESYRVGLQGLVAQAAAILGPLDSGSAAVGSAEGTDEDRERKDPAHDLDPGGGDL